MTEKDFMDEPVLLTEKEQAELREEQEYFRAQFAQVSCPPLPDSLSAEKIWNKICAGEGDGEITVDPSEVEKEWIKSDKTGKAGQVIAFPTATKEQSSEKKGKVTVFSGKNRRRWAIACTLVLAVGLSATFAVMQQPMKTAESMLDSSSQDTEQDAPQTRQVPQVTQNEVPQTQEQAADDAGIEENAVQVDAVSQESADAAPESAPETEEAAVPETESVEKSSDTPAPASAEQPILRSASAENDSEEAVSAQEGQTAEEELKQKILTALSEQPQREAEQQVQAAAFSVQPQAAMQDEAAPEQEVSYPLTSGSVSYSEQSGEAVLYDKNGQQTSVVSLPQSARLTVAGDYIYAATSEQGAVRIEGYAASNPANPQKMIEFSQQGQLLDWYASEETGCTVVTSFVLTAQQTEAGDFLPLVDGAPVPAQQIEIIESQLPEETGKYVITTVLTDDSVSTSCELFL